MPLIVRRYQSVAVADADPGPPPPTPANDWTEGARVARRARRGSAADPEVLFVASTAAVAPPADWTEGRAAGRSNVGRRRDDDLVGSPAPTTLAPDAWESAGTVRRSRRTPRLDDAPLSPQSVPPTPTPPGGWDGAESNRRLARKARPDDASPPALPATPFPEGWEAGTALAARRPRRLASDPETIAPTTAAAPPAGPLGWDADGPGRKLSRRGRPDDAPPTVQAVPAPPATPPIAWDGESRATRKVTRALRLEEPLVITAIAAVSVAPQGWQDAAGAARRRARPPVADSVLLIPVITTSFTGWEELTRTPGHARRAGAVGAAFDPIALGTIAASPVVWGWDALPPTHTPFLAAAIWSPESGDWLVSRPSVVRPPTYGRRLDAPGAGRTLQE